MKGLREFRSPDLFECGPGLLMQGQKQTSVNYFARIEDRLAAVSPKFNLRSWSRSSFSPALFVSKRIFEKVMVSFLKVILKAKDLKAIVSADDPKL